MVSAALLWASIHNLCGSTTPTTVAEASYLGWEERSGTAPRGWPRSARSTGSSMECAVSVFL